MSFRLFPLGIQKGSLAPQEQGESKRSLFGVEEGQSKRGGSVGWAEGDGKKYHW